MSLDVSSERVCYVHCNLCNTILAVSAGKDIVTNHSSCIRFTSHFIHDYVSDFYGSLVVIPYSNMYNFVTVRCGHCTNLLSVSIGHLQQINLPFLDFPNLNHFQDHGSYLGSSSKLSNRFLPFESALETNQPQMLPLRAPEKRQRVPSAYNKFIREEIQRIKATNPDISHREAFSTAAKNWAHYPHIRFGVNMEAAKQRAIVDDAPFIGDAPQKALGRLY